MSQYIPESGDFFVSNGRTLMCTSTQVSDSLICINYIENGRDTGAITAPPNINLNLIKVS